MGLYPQRRRANTAGADAVGPPQFRRYAPRSSCAPTALRRAFGFIVPSAKRRPTVRARRKATKTDGRRSSGSASGNSEPHSDVHQHSALAALALAAGVAGDCNLGLQLFVVEMHAGLRQPQRSVGCLWRCYRLACKRSGLPAVPRSDVSVTFRDRTG